MREDFLTFARGHGLLLDHVIADGQIHRVKTADKAHKENGAYRFCGTWGWVQVWHEHEHPIKWTRAKGQEGETHIREGMRQINEDLVVKRRAAARRAKEIVQAARIDYHHYLTNKGHAQTTLVFEDKMVVPMWMGDALVNVQLIDRDGGKKFLYGGALKGTCHVLGPREGCTWYVEGVATGFSVLAALKYMSMRGRVVCCFAAANMGQMAQAGGYVFADHDTAEERAGQTAAERSGQPWVMSPVPGEDANDLMLRAGVAAVANIMRPIMRRR